MKKAGASTVSKSSGAQKNLFSFFKKSTALPVEMTPEQSNTVETNRGDNNVEVKYDSEKQIITTTELKPTPTVPKPNISKSIVSSEASSKYSKKAKKSIRMSDNEEEEEEFEDDSIYSAASQSDEEDEESDLVSLADSDDSSPLGKRRLGKSRSYNAVKKTARVKLNSRKNITQKRSSQLVLSDEESDFASPIGIAIANKPSKTEIDSTSKKVRVAPPEKDFRVTTAQSTALPSKKLPNIISPDFKSQAISSPGTSTTPLSQMPTNNDISDEIQSPNLDGVGGVLARGSHEHNFLEFLQPNNIRDNNKLRPDHPNYNRRTLHVPETFLRNQTPAMAQWWQFKAQNMDTVLFFKVGKFYELFHMDSDIGFSELDLLYMKGSKAHNGFPEISYGKMANILVCKGYRVARVEQTETPEMLKERNDRKGGKKDKVVLRELCSVLSRGTRTYNHLDDLTLLEEESSPVNPSQSSASILICIVEKSGQDYHQQYSSDGEEDMVDVCMYGVCIVDTVIGNLTLGQFADDSQRSRLRTLLARYCPTEVLLATGTFSQETIGSVRLLCPKVSIDCLNPLELPSANAAIHMLEDGQYFAYKDTGTNSHRSDYPAVVRACVEGMQDGSSELLLRALGGCVWQLKRALIDYEIISLKRFFAYIPPDDSYQNEPITRNNVIFSTNTTDALETGGETPSDSGSPSESAYMTLDEVTLSNLEVLVNNHDRSEKGSLWAFVNRCRTAFGRRLLRSWLCRPLFRAKDIRHRAAAVEELVELLPEEAQKAREILKGIPDLERLLSRVHSSGLKKKVADHPDGRAVLYEMGAYNARKIRDFAEVLTGFETALRVVQVFENANFQSTLLKRVLTEPKTGGKFPITDISKLLKHFREIFDEKQAKKDGNIRPRLGVDPQFDEANKTIQKIELDLEEYLRKMKQHTGISDLKYYGTNKDRFQIEVPMHSCSKVPSDWASKSQKKTHRRFWTPFITERLGLLSAAEEKLAAAQKDTLRCICEKFSLSFSECMAAVTCLSQLDALLALAAVSSQPAYVRPTILDNRSDVDGDCVLMIRAGRHPMLENTLSQSGDGTSYIPNDLTLGGRTADLTYHPKMLLLSGPNMGGKSTLLRQTCLITILAQMGCRVPADEVALTPADRIFTRLGASDRILSGQSTFFVELAETATILRSATSNSLCILDELGRGTATFDGTAIAHAVVDHLTAKTRCRSLFATHYHSLVDDWEIDPRVQLGHMSCIVQAKEEHEEEEEENINGDGEVTFLYKLCVGSSPKSYGINVARLAGLPQYVIAVAVEQSRRFEKDTRQQSEGQVEVLVHRQRVRNVLERLLSLVHMKSSPCDNLTSEGEVVSAAELQYLVTELWRRCKAVV